MSRFTADRVLDLQVGDSRVHFDEGEEKDLNFPEGFELPEGLREAGAKPEPPAKVPAPKPRVAKPKEKPKVKPKAKRTTKRKR
jgi:hypothetical protein